MEIGKMNNYLINNAMNAKDSVTSQKRLENLKVAKDDERLMETCRDFESIFVNMMLRQMKNTLPEGGLIEKSQATEIFEDMHMEELSKEMSKGEGMGIAKMMYEQLKNR